MAAIWSFSETPGRANAIDDTVWFMYPGAAVNVLDSIQVDGEPDEVTPGKVLIEIVSIIPALPPGVSMVVSSDIPMPSVSVSFSAAQAWRLLGADVPVIGIDWQSQRGQAGGTVQSFGDVPIGAAEITRYEADPTYMPAYTITLRVTDWAARAGALLGTEVRSYRFGLQKDYSINRDRLVAFISSRG